MRKIICFVLIFFSANAASVFAQSHEAILFETKVYKISFPGQPTKMVKNMQSEVGQLSMNIAAFEPEPTSKDDNHVYMIMESDYPDSLIHSDKTEVLDKFFRGAIDGSVKSLNSKLLSETQGKVGKYPSRDIELDYGNGLAIIKMKIILCKSKLIMIQTITDTKKYSNPSVDKFFESFVLKIN